MKIFIARHIKFILRLPVAAAVAYGIWFLLETFSRGTIPMVRRTAVILDFAAALYFFFMIAFAGFMED